MAVIVGPSRAEIMRPFLQQWMSNMSQRDMENERLQQQAPLVQAQTDYTKAQTGETQQKTKLDLANSAAAGALARYQSIVKDDPQQAAAYIQQVIQAIPETAPILRSWGIAGPTTQTDVANAGAAKTMANQATSAAGGSEDAQARNTAFMLGTGQQLSPTAMTDQVQRQTKQSGIADAGTDYGKTVRTEGKLLPTGGEQLQAKTEEAMNAARIKAQAPLVAAQTSEATERGRGLKMQNDALNAMFPTAATGAPATGQPGATPNVNPIARDLANRDYDPKLLRGLMAKNPAGAAMLEQQAKTIDPTFSMADYEANVATKRAYAAGSQAQNITAINTAIRHLNSLYDDFQKLDNGRFPVANTVGNFVGRQVGNEGLQQAIQSVNKDADAVANELNKAFRGSSQLSEKDTASWRQGIGSNATPADIKGAISAAVGLLAGRNAELADGYKRGVGRPADRDFLGAGARAILGRFSKIGVNSGDLAAAGAPSSPQPGGSDGNITTTPDGMKWRKNPDGSMTQVQ